MRTSDYQKLSCLKTALEQEIARLGSEKWTTDRKVYSLEKELSHLKTSLKQMVTVDHTTLFTQLRKLWLENAIDSLNNENYGYGSYYELLVEKKHDAVDQFLWFNQQCLTKEEILHIKKATEYNDDFEPYTEVDAASGEILTIHDIIVRDYA